jgi:hypothetical protein
MSCRRRSVGGSFKAALYSTDFDLTENPMSEGGVWLQGDTDGLDWLNIQTNSGIAYGSAFVGENGKARYADPSACLKPLIIPFTGNQWCEGIVHRNPNNYTNPTDKHEIELLLRWHISAHSIYGYELLWGQNGEMAFVRWNGSANDYTQISTIAAYNDSTPHMANDGDLVRYEAINNKLYAYRNGVLVLESIDLTTYSGSGAGYITSGQPGIGNWPTTGSTLNAYGWKSWKAGNI